MTGADELYGINDQFFPGRTKFKEVQAILAAEGKQLQKVKGNKRSSVWTTDFETGGFVVGEVSISTLIVCVSRGVLATIGGTFDMDDVPKLTRTFTTRFGASTTVWKNNQSEALLDVKPQFNIATFRVIHIASLQQLDEDERAQPSRWSRWTRKLFG